MGVTGTNGKTTTTAWIAAALCAGLNASVVRITTVGTYLNDVFLDVPPTYDGFLAAMRIALDRGGKAAAIELTSESLSLGFAKAWPVKIGVFTNLTHDHLDAHESPEHYLASKAQLFAHLPPGGVAVLNGNDSASSLLTEILPKGVRPFYYGAPGRGEPIAPLELVATSVNLSWSATSLTIRAPAEWRAPPSISIRALGEVYAENALAALSAAVLFGAPAEVAATAIAACPPPPGRFEVVSERPYLVVDYAHSPDALLRVLRTAKRLCKGRLTVVFGAGGERDRQKRELMGRAAREADRVIVTTDNPRREDPAQIAAAIRKGLLGHAGAETILDRAAAIHEAVRTASPDDVVLVAGRGHETEQILADGARPFSDVAALRREAGLG